MKSIGVVRKVDELGRVVLPIELRRAYNIELKDPIEILVNQDTIILQKYTPKCVFCGSIDSVREKLGKLICKRCLGNITEL